MRKVVRDNVLSNNKVTDYANGFQYLDNVIQHFPTAEGYASRLNLRQENGVVALLPSTELPVDFFTYVYNYTDHLGNIRLSYAQDPDTQQLKIVEQNHYYPFGLRHTNYSGGKMQVVKEQELKRMAPTPEELLSYKYKYNGKEWQDELGLNMYDYGARNYDAAIGRWMNVDPKAEADRRWTPYRYAYDNPLRFIDPDGMLEEWVDKKGRKIVDSDGNYTVYATEKDIEIGENLKKTPEGKKQFDNLVNSEIPTTISIDEGSGPSTGTDFKTGNTKLTKDNKTGEVIKADITVYLGRIKELSNFLSRVYLAGNESALKNDQKLFHENTINDIEKIISVIGHEIDHAVNRDNHKLKGEAAELGPDKIEEQILIEIPMHR